MIDPKFDGKVLQFQVSHQYAHPPATLHDAPAYDSKTYDHRMLATEYPGKRMTPSHVRIVSRHRADFSDFIRHPGQEFVMVLSGAVRIEFERQEYIFCLETALEEEVKRARPLTYQQMQEGR